MYMRSTKKLIFLGILIAGWLLLIGFQPAQASEGSQPTQADDSLKPGDYRGIIKISLGLVSFMDTQVSGSSYHGYTEFNWEGKADLLANVINDEDIDSSISYLPVKIIQYSQNSFIADGQNYCSWSDNIKAMAKFHTLDPLAGNNYDPSQKKFNFNLIWGGVDSFLEAKGTGSGTMQGCPNAGNVLTGAQEIAIEEASTNIKVLTLRLTTVLNNDSMSGPCTLENWNAVIPLPNGESTRTTYECHWWALHVGSGDWKYK
jgi:hypothetical protein